MTIHDWIELAGGAVLLILVVLLLRRAIRDVERPEKYIEGPPELRRPESIRLTGGQS